MNDKVDNGWHIALSVFFWQIAISAGIALAALVLWDAKAALAGFYGGAVIAALPTLYFAWKVFSRSPDNSPHAILGRFYRGEAAKFVMTVMLFIIGVGLFAKQFFVVLVGYIAAQSAFRIVMSKLGAVSGSQD